MSAPRLRFRPGTRADRPFFDEVELQTTWDSLSPQEQERTTREHLRAALRETHAVLLERAGNQVVIAETEFGEKVGLLWFGVNRNLVSGEQEAWVYNVTVLPTWQGHGIGKRLLEHAEKLAREGGFSTLGLMVSAHNTVARRLYH
ncbi:MAG: GNAT family N-acetyltransferase, partial [Armatimonadetes bacterium]|nr:GNAT family N-acetyltransferase [Armatimonadota bacterium]